MTRSVTRSPCRTRLQRALAAALVCALLAPAVAAENAPLAQRALIQERHYVLEVSRPDAAASAIATLFAELGGELAEQSANVVTGRLGADRVEELRRRLRDVGRLVAEQAGAGEADSVNAELLARQTSAEQARERVLALDQQSRSVEDSLLIEQRVAAFDQQLAEVAAARVELGRRTRLVEVRVELRPDDSVAVESVPTVVLPFPWIAQLSLARLLNTHDSWEEDEDSSRQINHNLDLGVGLSGLQRMENGQAEPAAQALAFDLRMRGVAETDPVGMAMGSELRLGGGNGFVYDAALLLGVGASIGQLSSFGLLGGIGFGGWTSDNLSIALEVPVEAFFTIEFGDAARLLLFAQPRWTRTTESRKNGSPHTPFGDELSLGGSFTLPAAIGQSELDEGGLRLGFIYSEVRGGRMYAATVGLGFGAVDAY